MAKNELLPNRLRPKDILPLKQYLDQAEASYIKKILELTGGNVAETAGRLEISKRQLFYKINAYKLRHM